MKREKGDNKRGAAIMAAICVSLGAAFAFGSEYVAVASSSLVLPSAGVFAAKEFFEDALNKDKPSEEPISEEQNEKYTADNPPKEETPEKDKDELLSAEQAIAPENRQPIEEFQFASSSTASNYFCYGAGCIRNATYYANDEMLSAASGEVDFKVKLGSDEPQVLIMHTHTTESYERFDAGFYDVNFPTRSTEPEKNVIAVGKILCETLNKNGICAVAASEYHDYPEYDNSYSRSAETVKEYLEKYPSIKIVLDIHRDGMEREDKTRIKPTVVIDGKKAAQIMIICGADDGTMNMPNFRENLKFAVRLQDESERLFPGLARPLYFAYRHYNQNLTTGSLLIEVGSEASTLDEAKYTAELVGKIVAEYVKQNQ